MDLLSSAVQKLLPCLMRCHFFFENNICTWLLLLDSSCMFMTFRWNIFYIHQSNYTCCKVHFDINLIWSKYITEVLLCLLLLFSVLLCAKKCLSRVLVKNSFISLQQLCHYLYSTSLSFFLSISSLNPWFHYDSLKYLHACFKFILFSYIFYLLNCFEHSSFLFFLF